MELGGLQVLLGFCVEAAEVCACGSAVAGRAFEGAFVGAWDAFAVDTMGAFATANRDGHPIFNEVVGEVDSSFQIHPFGFGCYELKNFLFYVHPLKSPNPFWRRRRGNNSSRTGDMFRGNVHFCTQNK